jgi:hypothetical protein
MDFRGNTVAIPDSIRKIYAIIAKFFWCGLIATRTVLRQEQRRFADLCCPYTYLGELNGSY